MSGADKAQRQRQDLMVLDATHPARLALMELVEEAIEAAQLATAQPYGDADARAFNAGRLAHALDLKAVLTDVWDEAERRELDDEEDQADG